jgi:ABC-type multidrug transport system permease subunit
MTWLKSTIDERQTGEALRVTRIGFYIALFGLSLATLIQFHIFNADLSQIAGELVVLAVMGIIVSIGFWRYGLWDDLTVPSPRMYLLYSLIIVLVLTMPVAIGHYVNGGQNVLESIWFFIKMFAFSFPLTYAMLAMTGWLTRNRQNKLARNYSSGPESI